MTDDLIRWLDEIADGQLEQVGGKAAHLARLVRLGLPVPPGFVITTGAYRAFLAANDLAQADPEQVRARLLNAPMPAALTAPIVAAYQRLGDSAAVAVRSSGIAEDLAGASFAGQYDTFLDVAGPEALLQAVRACWASVWAPRAVAYREERGWAGEDAALAVLIQRMVPAEVAGVAFTANPLTGDRGEAVVSAVRGLGERLVSGEAEADEWVLRGDEIVRQRTPEGALTAEQARAVAHMARRIAAHLGAPQDVEWAISGGALFVLQARPMTALPEPVEWKAPVPGGWMRNFRLGEWLPEPVTPLFESWLLARIEVAEMAAEARDFGVHPRPPYHVTVHGWYFTSPIGGGVPVASVATVLLHHARTVVAFAWSLSRPQVADRVFLAQRAREWRAELLPRYQQLVASWQSRIAAASLAELSRLVDDIADVAGEYFWVFSLVGGHAWKAEKALARFYRRHLFAQVGGSHQELLRGLAMPFPEPPPHAVQSLDWMRPTLGEMVQATAGAEAAAAPSAELAARRRRMEDARRAAEKACHAALAGQPRRRRQFDLLLALAQRYAVLREEQAGWFTLGWPLLRRAALLLGEELRGRSVIERAEDVFFLTRAEVEAALASPPQPPSAPQDRRREVERRRAQWERQRRLSPPLTLGRGPGAGLLASAAESMRMPGASGQGQDRADALTGMPASPGRATGPVRVIRGPEDFARFQPGEVLVAQVTTPVWTPLFERAAAVVTDSGSVAAHASLVAREYGIPAVVGTGDATARLRDGQIVTVDGSVGIVEVRP